MAANRTYEEVLAALDAMGARQGATNRSAPLPTGGPGRYGTSFVQEGGKLGISDADAAIAAAMQQAIDSGASAGELAQMLPALSEKYGVGPRSVPLNEILAAVKYRDERAARGGRGPSGITARPAQTPLTSAQRADIAELNDPSNAYDAKFGNVISAGLAPDIAGLVSPDLERRMRESQQYYADASPWASLGGEMAGYIAPSTAFSKLMNPAALALATDVVLPTAIGAGENPNDRVGGAANSFLENMLVAGPANVAGIKLGDLASAYLHGRAAPDIGDITTEAVAPTGPLALPAPPPQLALPAPGPGLPSFAAKPRGGQWWPDAPIAGPQMPDAEPGSIQEILNGLTDNTSPEAAARLAAAVTPEVVPGYRDWLQKALTKYYKTDFGAPTDPLRGLAERGMHYDPEMTPEKWQKTVNDYLMEDTIGAYTVPGTPGYDAGASEELLGVAPWLAKQPVTDKLYGIGSGGLDMSYLTDEMKHALNPEETGLPMDLAVRPESLQRMTLAQAAEHVGRINQFRTKQAEQERLAAALADANSPAVIPFKDYANDPSGMRWVEFKMPELNEALDTDFDRQMLDFAAKEGTDISPEALSTSRRERAETAVREALGREGKILDICVGDPSQPHCRNIIEGKSRIFSLRDAEGRPHVTVETMPGDADARFARLPQEVRTEVERAARERLYGDPDAVTQPGDFDRLIAEMDRDINARYGPPAESIVQIKGKKNSRPSDKYLPFVQDFVKSQKWGNVGDLSNTGLIRLPDGRYITQPQLEEAFAKINEARPDDWDIPSYARDLPSVFATNPHVWGKLAPHFEGYAIGGRVERDRCFCQHPFSAKG